MHDADQDRGTEVDELREQLAAAQAARDAERRRLTDHILAVQAELNAATRRSDLAARRHHWVVAQRTTVEAGLRQRIDDLRRRDEVLRYERDRAQWRVEKLQQGRGWRLGQAVGPVRRDPRKLWRALRDVVGVLRHRPTSSPPPARPATAPAAELPTPADTEHPPRLALDGPAPTPRLLAVATVLAPDRERDLSHEWVSQPIDAASWEDVLRDASPDLLIVDDEGWLDAQAASDAWLDEALGRARDAGVPTVLWDTRRLPSTAVDERVGRRFDRILCSFSETVDSYHVATGSDAVALFPPAVQTRIFRPVAGGAETGVLSLRSLSAPDAESSLAEAARAVTTEPVDVEQPRLDDAGRPVPPAVAARDHVAAVVELSRATDEREIRNLLEVVATRRLVLAGGPLPDQLDDLVLHASSVDEAREALRTLLGAEELRARLCHGAERRVRESHDLSDQVGRLLTDLGLAAPAPRPTLAFMVPTNRPGKLDAIVENLGRQSYPGLRATLVLHGVDVDEGRARELAASHGIDRFEIVHVPAAVALGDVFNLGFAACDADLVGKMDDDDYYGPEYAGDLVADLGRASADIVGKWAHYAYSEALDATLLRYPSGEHSFQPLLAISTLILRPAILDEVQFLPMGKGSGSQFLREAGAAGARIYAGNRFGYLYNRFSGEGHEHTWPVGDYEFAARSRFIGRGRNLVTVDA